jgi:hypothetical protein
MERGAGGRWDMLWQNISTELSTDAGVGGSYGDLASSKRNELKFCKTNQRLTIKETKCKKKCN